MAAPKWLGNMAKAVHPIAVDVPKQVAGERKVPCVTHCPSRASDYSQAGVSERGPCPAGGALAMPGAEKRHFGGVHVLFPAMVAAALVFGVPWVAFLGPVKGEVRVELTARIVAVAAPKWLGNMAKAVHPIAVDVLLAPPAL